MAYEDTSVDVTAGQELELSGGGGRMSDEDAARTSAVLGLPVVVTFSDGSTFDATGAGASSQANGDGTTRVSKGATFDRGVDVGEIASVTVGGVTVGVG